MKIVRPISIFTLIMVLVACSMGVPGPVSQTPQNLNTQNFIKPASYQENIAPDPIIVRKKSQVNKSTINEPSDEDIQEVESELKTSGLNIEELKDSGSLDFTTQSFRRRIFVAQFTSKKLKRKQKFKIQIPKNGNFQLKLKVGNHYEILDNDATDGQAEIQMPASTLKTYIHLNRKRRINSTLKIEDPLYHIKDTLNTKHKRWLSRTQWSKIGLRPIPVPSEWNSAFENDFVLKFETTDVNSFHMVWLKKNKAAPYPPGINKVGPEGGMITLPGVTELQIPEGALEQEETISIQEILEHEIFPSVVQLSATIKILPQNLILKKPFLIRMEYDTSLVGQNHPAVVDYTYLKSNCAPESGVCIGSLAPVTEIEDMELDTWHLLPELHEEIFVTMLERHIGKKVDVYSRTNNNFSAQNIDAAAKHFKIINELGDTYSESDIRFFLSSMNSTWETYKTLFGNPMPNKYMKGGTLPVYLTNAARIAFVDAVPREIQILLFPIFLLAAIIIGQ